MNNDLISRKALIEAYDKAHQGSPGGARKLIEEAPGVDAVEVIRCRDCKSFCHLIGKGDSAIFGCTYMGRDVKPNDFCSYGKRRNDGNL